MNDRNATAAVLPVVVIDSEALDALLQIATETETRLIQSAGPSLRPLEQAHIRKRVESELRPFGVDAKATSEAASAVASIVYVKVVANIPFAVALSIIGCKVVPAGGVERDRLRRVSERLDRLAATCGDLYTICPNKDLVARSLQVDPDRGKYEYKDMVHWKWYEVATDAVARLAASPDGDLPTMLPPAEAGSATQQRRSARQARWLELRRRHQDA